VYACKYLQKESVALIHMYTCDMNTYICVYIFKYAYICVVYIHTWMCGWYTHSYMHKVLIYFTCIHVNIHRRDRQHLKPINRELCVQHNTLQHTATSCNSCNKLQQSATICNTLHSECNNLHNMKCAPVCNALQQSTTRCNTLYVRFVGLCER